ncbi:hypothetical protein C9J21_20405 [Photobacterium phosphoreum]|uniref:hypothetical protein n=1 Tax=Photobacterium phosphoreum TaxID=659 RepID=UPI000D1739F3|nr:hypothetical protein [Photobacterium phosphoreum]PSW28712.1 hypothetical protein C9J21_20405 [Photobacterium phosphoreum]
MPTLSKIISQILELTPNCLVPVDFNQSKILAASYELNFNDGFKAIQQEIVIEIKNSKNKILRAALIQCSFDKIGFVSERELDWRYLRADFERKTNKLAFQGYVNKVNRREKSVSNYLFNHFYPILIKQSSYLKDVMKQHNSLELKHVITSITNHVQKAVMTDEVCSWPLNRQRAYMDGMNSMISNYLSLLSNESNNLYCDAITEQINTLQCLEEPSEYESSCTKKTIDALSVLRADLLNDKDLECNSTRLEMIEENWLHNFANSLNKESENPYSEKSISKYYELLSQWVNSFTHEQVSAMATQVSINFKA